MTQTPAPPTPERSGESAAAPSHWLTTAIGRTVRRSPATLGYLVLLWVVALLTRSLPDGPVEPLASMATPRLAELPAHPLGSVLSLVVAPSLAVHLWASVALLLVGLLAEPRVGSLRWVALLVGCHIAGLWLTLAASAAIRPVLPDWATSVADVRVGPAVGIAGAALAASRILPGVLRRRVRLLTLTVILTMALFDGGGTSVRLVVAALVGLVLARWLVPGTPEPSPLGSIHEARALVATIVAAIGIGPILSSFLGFGPGPFSVLGSFIAPPGGYQLPPGEQACPPDLDARDCALSTLFLDPGPGGVIMTCLPAVLFVIVAFGLRRGRRLAWLIGVVSLLAFLAISINAFILQPMHWAADSDEDPGAQFAYGLLPCLAILAVLAMLVLTRRLFLAPSRPGTRAALVTRVVAAAVGGVAAYLALGLASADQWAPRAQAPTLFTDALLRLVPTDYAFGALVDHAPTTALTRAIYVGVGILVWGIALAALAIALRRRPRGQRAADRARTLLHRHGGPSLAWMGLWDGNTHWFSADGEAYVPYRVIGNVALTTGDPVGPAERTEEHLQEFLSFAEAHGLTVAFYSATQALADRLKARGWESAQIAEETVIPLTGLEFKGKKFQDVRTALNQAAKQGIRTEWTTWPQAPLDVRLQIRRISEEWVSDQSLPEMGFTLGGIDELDDDEVRLLLARHEDGTVHGVASWLPIHGEDRVIGWTLDFMRRRHDAFRSTMELLIGQAALDLKAEGFEVLSLSGAPLATVDEPGEQRQPDGLDRVLEAVGRRLEPVYGFRSLLRFKAKFQPQYQPMYLVYADPTALPAIGTAVARAYVPEASVGMVWQLGKALRAASRPKAAA